MSDDPTTSSIHLILTSGAAPDNAVSKGDREDFFRARDSADGAKEPTLNCSKGFHRGIVSEAMLSQGVKKCLSMYA